MAGGSITLLHLHVLVSGLRRLNPAFSWDCRCGFSQWFELLTKWWLTYERDHLERGHSRRIGRFKGRRFWTSWFELIASLAPMAVLSVTCLQSTLHTAARGVVTYEWSKVAFLLETLQWLPNIPWITSTLPPHQRPADPRPFSPLQPHLKGQSHLQPKLDPLNTRIDLEPSPSPWAGATRHLSKHPLSLLLRECPKMLHSPDASHFMPAPSALPESSKGNSCGPSPFEKQFQFPCRDLEITRRKGGAPYTSQWTQHHLSSQKDGMILPFKPTGISLFPAYQLPSSRTCVLVDSLLSLLNIHATYIRYHVYTLLWKR